MGRIFNLPKLLRQRFTIDSHKVSGYFLTMDKSHCLYQASSGFIYEFEETGIKDMPFKFTRLK